MIFVRRNVNLIPKDVLDAAAEARATLERLPEKQRSFYIKKKSHLWRAFGRYLSKMSYGKCWYSESPDPQSFFDVDHFRPKSESKRSNSEVDKPGYEWLAFSWENFRYAANRSNRVSKNEKSKVVDGKGSWFPLLNGVKACWNNRCEGNERPILLDPVNRDDVRLIEVSAGGLIVPSKLAVGSAKDRVKRSCELYGLNLPGITGARLRLIREINDLVGVLDKTLEAAINPAMANEAADLLPVRDQTAILEKKALPDHPYARTARSALIRAGWGCLCPLPEEREAGQAA
ncbi:MAG: hypothetical protein V4710_19640 [Verrucomicrobiota bacterium]